MSDKRLHPRAAGGPPAFRVDELEGAAVVAIQRQLTIANRQELKDRVLDELGKGRRAFVLDFAETEYIDSSGLGVLVSLSKTIEEAGGALRLAGLGSDLRTLFELTKLDTLFKIAESKDQAIVSLRR